MEDIYIKTKFVNCVICGNYKNISLVFEFKSLIENLCYPCSYNKLKNHYKVLLLEDCDNIQLPKEVINIIVNYFLTPLSFIKKLIMKIPNDNKLLISSLEELDNIKGNDNLKERIGDIRNIHINPDYVSKYNFSVLLKGDSSDELTKIAIIIGKIFRIFIFNDVRSQDIKILKRSDLIGQYVGFTSKKTIDLLEKIENSIIFFEDCIVNNENDNFGKEALITIINHENIIDRSNVYIFTECNSIKCRYDYVFDYKKEI